MTHDDQVDHPAHYGGDTPYEVIKVAEAWGLQHNAYRFNAVKYLARAGKKGDALVDLRKAAWYVAREIAALEGGLAKPRVLCDVTICEDLGVHGSVNAHACAGVQAQHGGEPNWPCLCCCHPGFEEARAKSGPVPPWKFGTPIPGPGPLSREFVREASEWRGHVTCVAGADKYGCASRRGAVEPACACACHEGKVGRPQPCSSAACRKRGLVGSTTPSKCATAQGHGEGLRCACQCHGPLIEVAEQEGTA